MGEGREPRPCEECGNTDVIVAKREPVPDGRDWLTVVCPDCGTQRRD